MSFLSKLLSTISGNNGLKVSEQLLFDKVVGFRGIVPGVGTSTIVQNTAIALSETTNYAICVVDTNFLYPTQYPLLVSHMETGKRKDLLDFAGDLSDVALETSYRNVSLVSMSNRTIIDMMSSRDSELTVDKLMGALKSYFDIILVDLSYEPTHIATHSAIKCNRVINIADQSIKCMFNLRKSINTMATLAVPLAKANKVILNKVVPDVVTNTKGVIEEAQLELIGEIPLSLEVAKNGVSGRGIWSSITSNHDIHAFSSVINTILEDIIHITPLNEKYIDEQEVENSKKQHKQKPSKTKTKESVETIETKKTDTTEKEGKKKLFGRKDKKTDKNKVVTTQEPVSKDIEDEVEEVDTSVPIAFIGGDDGKIVIEDKDTQDNGLEEEQIGDEFIGGVFDEDDK